MLKRNVKLLVSTYLVDLQEPDQAKRFVEQRIERFSTSGKSDSTVLAHYYEMLAWIDQTQKNYKGAFDRYEDAVRVTQANLPSKTWYDAPVFLSAATFYIAQFPNLNRKAASYLSQQLASVDAFDHERTPDYWSVNDKLALALLNSGDEIGAKKRFQITLDRIFASKDSQPIGIGSDFAIVAKHCIVDKAMRKQLLEKTRASLVTTRGNWQTRRDKTSLRSSEAKIYAEQLIGYSLLSLELDEKKTALETIEEAVKMAHGGFLSNATRYTVVNTYAYILRSLGRHDDANKAERQLSLPAR